MRCWCTESNEPQLVTNKLFPVAVRDCLALEKGGHIVRGLEMARLERLRCGRGG